MILCPLIKQKKLNIDPNYPQIFKFLPYVQLYMEFQYKTVRDFLRFQIALTRSIFELEKCFFFLNRSESRQKLIGTIIMVLVRLLRASSGIKQRLRPPRSELSHQSPVCWGYQPLLVCLGVGIHVQFGQGFAAVGPLGVFDTFPNYRI